VTAQPYISAAAFQAHPTYLDLDGLRSGSTSQADQDAELTNILLMASEWADNQLDMPIGAHSYTQRTRARADGKGCLRFHAEHSPVIAVGQVGYGYSPTALTAIDGSGAWVENGANLVVPMSTSSGAWSGSLQFGAPAAGGELFVQAAITAGRVATVLTADATAGATQLTVADPTGIQAGGTYRIWEPGAEETITVSTTWVPSPVGTAPTPRSVNLATATRYPHTAGHDLSGLTADQRLAVTQYATSLLLRPGNAAETTYPGTTMTSSVSSKSGRSAGDYAKDAIATLASYRRIR
jgi:hypothetical protein